MTLGKRNYRLIHLLDICGPVSFAVCLSLSLLACSTLSAHASQLSTPGGGPTDGSMAGTVVALPMNASTALFHNPAQLSLLPRSFSAGLLAFRFHPSFENDAGYQSTSRELPIAPNWGYVTDAFAPFQFGIGMYGSLGFMFNHMSDPANGVPNNFFTELASVSLVPSIAYSLRPNLHVGVSLNPTYGRLKFKSPSPVGRLDVDARGPGIFGTVGILYQPTPRLNLGLAYKTPGNIWMFGNARVNGAADDASVSFKIPQNVKLGFAYDLTDRLTVTGQGSWTAYSAFEDSHLRFEKRSFLNTSAVADAKDRWRLGTGVQYEFLPGIKFRASFAYEPWAIKDSSLTPTLADTTDYIFPLGLSIERGDWRVDLGGALSHTETRRASRAENPFFAGRYDLDMTLFGVQVTRRFGSSQSSPVDNQTSRVFPSSYASIPHAYATIPEGKTESVLNTLITQVSGGQCHDLTLLQPRIAGCRFGIHVVGFVGARPTEVAYQQASVPHGTEETQETSNAALDTLIARLASTQGFSQAVGSGD